MRINPFGEKPPNEEPPDQESKSWWQRMWKKHKYVLGWIACGFVLSWIFFAPKPQSSELAHTPTNEYRAALRENRVVSVFVEDSPSAGALWHWTERIKTSNGEESTVGKTLYATEGEKDAWLKELEVNYPKIPVRVGLQVDRSGRKQDEISYSDFLAYVERGKIKWVRIDPYRGRIIGQLKDSNNEFVSQGIVTEDTIALLKEKGAAIRFEPRPQSSPWSNILTGMLPMILIIAVFMLMMRQAQAGGSNQATSFGKSRARLYSGDRKVKVTFEDVAGLDEAKEELEEIVEFLKHPKKFEAMGAKIPRGVLLVGPPGSGKTLLAKAIAGEAGVPFFSISGSEFVEMFVGVGASRVRDLFATAKNSAPCLVFIDELDAVGRQRGAGLGGGHDEREQTLNQILVEMDGFEPNAGIIVIGATNRPDILDAALLRPGRFGDRRIIIDNPDTEGRKKILEVHCRGKPLAPEVDLNILTKRTPGFSGADLANMVNEAALLAARWNKKKIGMAELSEAIERVIAGPQKKSQAIAMIKREGRRTSYHEAGHGLLAHLDPNADKPHKLVIGPRGQALGYMISIPEEQWTWTRVELIARIKVGMAGRAAEVLIYYPQLKAVKPDAKEEDVMSTSAVDDLEKSTELARKIVTEFGMSRELKQVYLGGADKQVFLGKDLTTRGHYSEQTAHEIDIVVRKIVQRCYEKAKEELSKHMEELHRLADALLERKALEGEEIELAIKGKLPPPEEKPLI